MPVQTFRSPNFFDREIDLSATAPVGPTGVPAGIIGTSNKGPAFIPVTVGDFNQFIAKFGNLDPNRYGPYAVNTFLANRNALTFLRVLGAGANASGTDINRAADTGRVLNAGFHLDGAAVSGDAGSRYNNVVQFLVAQHALRPEEPYGQADFTDNDSFVPGSTVVNLVRGVIIPASGSRVMIASMDADLASANITALHDMGQADVNGNFKLIVSSSLGSAFYSDDGNPGCHIVTASLDPSATNYFVKVLNTDPKNFVSMQHLVYGDFAVDDEIATVGTIGGTIGQVVGLLEGANVSSAVTVSNDTYTAAPYHDKTVFRSTFGAFDTRYQTPTTPSFISQPFGKTEFDLFTVEALDDGAYANNLYKVSIANLQASTDASNKYGTFSVQVRDWNDTDINPNILEQFNNCTLDPNASNYVANVIGDRKLFYNFDAEDPNERRIIAAGKYPNNSSYVRIVMADAVDRGQVPATCLPFGFRGASVLKTNDNLADTTPSTPRLAGYLTGSAATSLIKAIVPPIPFRSKVTKGTRPQTGWFGKPGTTEVTINTMYWGTKFERNDIPLNPNVETSPNNFLNSLTKFQGLALLDTVVTGSGADTFNDNKFTLSKVAFPNGSLTDLTSSVETTMLGAAYVRNAVVDSSQYTINDSAFGGNRITFATLLGKGTPAQFNRFADFTKFTTFMQGGFDGTNFLDIDAERMNDKSTSFEENPLTLEAGGAYTAYVPAGFSTNQNGTGQQNSTVSSYIAAINIMTDPLEINHNILAIPGIREPFITDYAANAVKAYGLAYDIMDVERFDENGYRLFDATVNANGTPARPDVNQTAAGVDTRGIDNNYVGVYFPDVIITDATNNKRVKVPASIAALGALGFNDRVGYPWFAPAGFNRASLDFVNNVEVRLTAGDRDTLYDARINPIATFPRQGFAIFGQKTMQIRKSALDRVNVRRLILEVKRIIMGIAQGLEFEQNTPAVWNKFVSQSSLQLGLIQAQQGIEAFQVIMNETNNSDQDMQLNKLNGRVIVVPTRVIEFVAIDFVITNSGISFI